MRAEENGRRKAGKTEERTGKKPESNQGRVHEKNSNKKMVGRMKTD